MEVSHGPTLIDNNVLLSQMSLKYASQGLAFVHNLVAGSFTAVGMGVNNGTKSLVSPRYTPYHMIHRTEVAGFMTILHGDVRFYNNIFVQRKHREGFDNICAKIAPNAGGWTDMNLRVGTVPYEGYPTEFIIPYGWVVAGGVIAIGILLSLTKWNNNQLEIPVDNMDY